MLAVLWLSFSAVLAQTTSITQLTFPSSSLAGSLEPISVRVAVPYDGAKPGYWLMIGITDPALNNTIIAGTAEASPNICVNQPLMQALCQVQTRSGSGVETIQFKIGGIFDSIQRQGTWSLQITAELLDANYTVLARSDQHFAIYLATVSLVINVPSNVTVLVDGVARPGGSIPIALGRHSVAIPVFFAINETDRLHFDHWSDGVLQPNRTVYISSNAELTAFYHTQHRLMIISTAGANVSGAGWYDDGSIANFSLSQTQLPAGPLSIVGARTTFQGWFENGKLITSSPSGTIEMDHSHTVTAEWAADYTEPIIVFALVAIGVGFGVFYAIRRSTRKTKRSSPRRSRVSSRRTRVRRTSKRR